MIDEVKLETNSFYFNFGVGVIFITYLKTIMIQMFFAVN